MTESKGETQWPQEVHSGGDRKRERDKKEKREKEEDRKGRKVKQKVCS